MRNGQARWWAVLIAWAMVSCGGSSEEKGPPPDPPGTISMNMEDGGRISFEIEQCGAGAPSLQCSMGCIWSYAAIFFYKSSLNLLGVSRSDCATQYSAVEIADVGPVAGIAEVTNKSAPGFTSTLAAQVGHGYVIRYTKGGGAPTYLRFYVEGWLTNAITGGVGGVRTKYQVF